MRLILLWAAVAVTIHAVVRLIWPIQGGELATDLDLVAAAICVGCVAIVDAIDRSRPKVVSSANGGGPGKE